MAQYISTGKINFPKTILGLLFGVAMALIIGPAYAWLNSINPFIILDILIWVVIIVALMGTAIGIVRIGLIRNNIVKVMVVLIVCLIAWYAQWVFTVKHDYWTSLLKFKSVFREMMDWSDEHEISIGRGSSSGTGISGVALKVMEIFELLIFLSPSLFIFKFQKDYFCESCGEFNTNAEYYVNNLDESKLHSAEQSGDFRFIAELPSHKGTPKVAGANGQTVWSVEFSHCKKCMQNGVIDIARGTWKADRKGNFSFNRNSNLIDKALVNNITIPVVLGSLPN